MAHGVAISNMAKQKSYVKNGKFRALLQTFSRQSRQRVHEILGFSEADRQGIPKAAL